MEEKLKRLQSEEYLDLMLEHGTINDIPDLVTSVRHLRKELAELQQALAQGAATDTVFSALYMGAKKMRGYAKKVALLHNAYVVAEGIDQLPLPGQTESGGTGEH